MQNYLLLKQNKKKQMKLLSNCLFRNRKSVSQPETERKSLYNYNMHNTYLRIFVTTSVCSLQVKDYKC